jgi:hypothetical protein
LEWPSRRADRKAAATHLFHLLKRHPEFEAKRGVGIDHFSIHDTLYKGREFEIVRQDGSIDGFSFYKCLLLRNAE